MSLLDELLKKAISANRAPVQSDVPGSLLAMLTQGNQNNGPQFDINSFINRPAPQLPQLPEPQQFQSSGLGKTIISSLLGEWFDDRKYNKDLERADSERQAASDELDQIYKSGLSGKDLYYALSKARSKTANDIAKKGLEPTDPDKAKIVEMGAPGREGMRQQALFDPVTKQLVPIGEPWKPQSGVTVNTGDAPMMEPATNDDKIKYGLDPRIPATRNNKTGEVVQHPQTGITEDMRKSAQYYRGLTQGNDKINAMVADPSWNTGAPPAKDYLGSVAKSTDLPFISDLGNAVQSPSAQMFDQAKMQFQVNAIHTLTGAGYSQREAMDKVEAYLPSRYGDTPEVSKWKAEGRQSIVDGTFDRAGSAIPDNKTPIPNLPPVKNGMEMNGYIYTGPDGDAAAAADSKNWRPK